MRSVLALLAACTMGVALAAPAAGSDAMTPPELRLELGMHAAPLRYAARDPKDRYIITVGDDATARVWSLPDLDLLQVFRPPLSQPDPDQSLDAIAIAPDGDLAAVSGGLHGEDGIFLFAPLSGRLVRHLPLRAQNTYALAFSPDGKWLAAGLAKFGIRIWSVQDWAIKTEDPSYKGTIQGIDFSPAGLLAATETTGHIHLYDPQFAPLKNVTTAAGNIPFSVKFSPNGSRLAIGFGDVPRVEIRSADDLSLIAKPDSGLRSGDLDAIAWSADAETLLAAGQSVRSGDAAASVLAWSSGGEARQDRYPAASRFDWIAALLPRPDGSIVVAARDPALAVADERGIRAIKPRPFLAFPHAAPLPGFPSCRMRISADGRTVQVPLADPRDGFLRIQAQPLQISFAGRDDPALGAAAAVNPGSGLVMRAEDWYERRSLTVAGRKTALDRFDYIDAIDARVDGVAIGTRWQLQLINSAGATLWRQPVPVTVKCIARTEDLRFVAAALDDGMVRWYRGSDGKPLLSVFVHADRRRWVAFTPSGYYVGSPDGEDMVRWELHRDDRTGASPDMMRDRFRNPDVVLRALDLPDMESTQRSNETSRDK